MYEIFLMLATRVCNLVIRAFAFRQFFENYLLRAKRRCNFANFGRNFFKGWHGSTTSPSDSVAKFTTPQSMPTADIEVRKVLACGKAPGGLRT
jgi:hypothetical protein